MTKPLIIIKMNLSLLDQTLLFIVYVLTAVAFVWLYHVWWRLSAHNIIIFAALGLVLAGIIYAVVSYFVASDTIPLGGILWVWPFCCGVIALAFSWRRLRTITANVAVLLTSLLLFALIVNQHYQFRPTVGSLFGAAVDVTLDESAPTQKQSSSYAEDTFTPLAGQPQKGELRKFVAASSDAKYQPREGRVYVPPAAVNDTSIRLPVMVLLHGYPGGPIDWVNGGGIKDVMDNFAQKHRGLAPIVVMPDYNGVKNSDTECVNSPIFGKVENYLTIDVPKAIRDQLPQASRDNRAWTIAGYSAGGMCSAMLAIRHPEIFQNYMNISGSSHPYIDDGTTLKNLFGDSKTEQAAHDTLQLLSKGNAAFASMNGWFYFGVDDDAKLNTDIKNQYQAAKQASTNVALGQTSGSHTFSVWRKGYELGLDWVMENIKFTRDRK